METYTLLRAFADSWMVLALTLFFIGMVLWVFRPAARKLQKDAATSIFRNEQQPAPPKGADTAVSDPAVSDPAVSDPAVSDSAVKEVRDVR